MRSCLAMVFTTLSVGIVIGTMAGIDGLDRLILVAPFGALGLLSLLWEESK